MVAVSPTGKLLEVGVDQRNLDLVADDRGRRVGIGEGLAGRTGDGDGGGTDGDGVGRGMVGILGVVGDDVEGGRRVVLGHGAGVGDRLRQVVGAVDGDGERRGVLQPAGVADRVVEDVGGGLGRGGQRLHHGVGLIHQIGIGTVGIQRQGAMGSGQRRADRAGRDRAAFGAGVDRDHGERIAWILRVGVLDVAGSTGAEDDVAGGIEAGDGVVEAALLGGGDGIVVGDRRGVRNHIDGEGLLAVQRAVAGIHRDVVGRTARLVKMILLGRRP